ncbi:aminopeptidase N-like [Lytechinus pictus]|uniref:aminopeptidase N-like n=1 Tax=Lytechinus pictus TaxID=7653 RepID=UPI0030B9B652
MAKSGKFELDDETGMKKPKGYFFSTRHLILIVILAIVLVIVVACMAFFIPDRSCKPTSTDDPSVAGEQTTEAPEEDWTGRLPRNLVPTIYHIYLKPYLYEDDLGPDDRLFTFDGRVKINMTCDVATDVITLHSKNITLLSYELVDDVGNAVTITDVTYGEKYDFVHFHVGMLLEQSRNYELVIEYVGGLSNSSTGFFRSSYKEGGETRWLAETQMQATFARQALPCFDEPDFKAVFYTEIEHRADMVALANGIEESETETGEGWIKTKYGATPLMSNYLLAFVVGYFNYTERFSDRGVRYRVWSRPEKLDATGYGLDLAINITTYFESYFNITFDLPKQDMIATHGGGAMENWGLIIYNEKYLLFDSKIDTAESKLWVATVIAHELVHQWIGNIVTCTWWDDIWLNEGITSYFELLGMDSAEPNWRIHEHRRIEKKNGYQKDALLTSHPLRPPLNKPDDIDGIFDSITYHKGAEVTQMLRTMLGEEVFKNGLRAYLSRHKLGNVVSDDLWAALTEFDEGIGDHDVKTIMDTWVLQMGYPVVEFRRVNGRQLNASQERFLLDYDAEADAKANEKYDNLGYLWYIYLTYTQKTGANYEMPQSTWIEQEPWALVDLPSTVGNDDWYLGNVQQSGFFRVNYDDENWARLGQQLFDDHMVIPVTTRSQLLDDAFTLARAGRVDYPIALDLTRYLAKETEYVSWKVVLEYFSHIKDMISIDASYGYLERYMLQQVQSLYDQLGWDDDPETDSLLEQLNRINAIDTSCKYNNQDCLDKASALYAEYMDIDSNNTENKSDYDINPISPNLRASTYCYAIQEGFEEEWNFGWNKFIQDQSEGNMDWIKSLACSKTPWILNRFLHYSLNSTLLEKKWSASIIIYVSKSPIGRVIAWNFVRDKWEQLKENFGEDSFHFKRLIVDVTSNFNTRLQLKELQAFGEHTDLEAVKSEYEKAIRNTRKNIEWMENNSGIISTWLQSATLNGGI